MAQYISEYKKGRTKAFLHDHQGIYFLDHITKASAFTIFCGGEDEMLDYLKTNGWKLVALHRY